MSEEEKKKSNLENKEPEEKELGEAKSVHFRSILW